MANAHVRVCPWRSSGHENEGRGPSGFWQDTGTEKWGGGEENLSKRRHPGPSTQQIQTPPFTALQCPPMYRISVQCHDVRAEVDTHPRMHLDTRNIPQLQSRRALSRRLRAPRADEREAEAQTTRTKAELFSAITRQRVAPASTRASAPSTATNTLATPETSGPHFAVGWHRHVLFRTAESGKAVHESGACALRTEHTPTHGESTHAYQCGQARRRTAGQVPNRARCPLSCSPSWSPRLRSPSGAAEGSKVGQNK